MKIQWNTNSTSVCNSLWASMELAGSNDILLSVYRSTATGKYEHMVWICGMAIYSKSTHDCCIAAMVHAEAAASNLIDEIAAKSAIWQEV